MDWVKRLLSICGAIGVVVFSWGNMEEKDDTMWWFELLEGICNGAKLAELDKGVLGWENILLSGGIGAEKVVISVETLVIGFDAI